MKVLKLFSVALLGLCICKYLNLGVHWTFLIGAISGQIQMVILMSNE